MTKTKDKHRLLDLGIIDNECFLFVGMKSYKKFLDKYADGWGESAKEYWDLYEENKNNNGFCVMNTNISSVCIVINTDKRTKAQQRSTAVHEAVHASCFLLECIGEEYDSNSEILPRITQRIYENLVEMI